MKFEYREVDGERMECASCQFPAPLAEFGQREPDLLCELCASTDAGNALRHPARFDGSTLKTICYVGNAILAAIGQK